jgi:hypothetical protein
VTLAGFRSRNHPQQVGKRGRNPLVDDRGTDPALFAKLHERFAFTIDVAASAANAKLPRYFTEAQDGLAQPWVGERVWCNPWVDKAWRSWNVGFCVEEPGADLIVMLLPANRTEQGWWQRRVEPAREPDGPLRVEFMPGRPRFVAPGAEAIGPNERPPFGCCLLIWGAP